MLVQNMEPRSRTIGSLHLIPGYNKVEDKAWDALAKSPKWAKPIKGLIEYGNIKVEDSRTKVTIAVVEKTYDVELLKSWSNTAKGPLKGAITKQIEMMESRGDEDDNLGNL